MTNYILCLFFLTVLAFSSEKATAQYGSNNQFFEVGMDLGGLVSLSPLTPYGKFGAWKQVHVPSIDVFITSPIIGPLSLRGKFFVGQFGADDSKTNGYSSWDWLKEYRKVRFETSVKELSAVLMYNFNGRNTDAGVPKKISVYVFAGAGVAFVHVTRNWSNFNAAYFAVQNPSLINSLAEDTAHALPNTAFVMPLGCGLKYALSPQWSLLFEANFRYTKQQYLDGFSSVGNNQTSEAYNQKKDYYYYGASFGIAYKIFTIGGKNASRLDCPKVVW